MFRKAMVFGMLAVKHVNERHDGIVSEALQLPEGFNMTFDIVDTLMTPSVAARGTDTMITEGADVIIGPLFAHEAGPVSLIAGIRSTPVVAYGPTAPRLSDKSVYPFFNRVCFDSSAVARAMVAEAKQHGWRTISLLYSEDMWVWQGGPDSGSQESK
eukprot:3639658-Rhodomonas_salina.1